MTYRYKIILLLAFSLLTGRVILCQERPHKKKGEEVIMDCSFENGIFIQGASSASPDPYARMHPFTKNKETPNWYLPQWGSRHLLSNTNPQIHNDTVIFENNAKRVYFHRKENASTLIGLDVFSSKEYDEARNLHEDWVHLLLEQKYSNFVWLKNASQLQYKIKAKMKFCINRMGTSFDPGLHTAQITQFFTIQNRNENSPHFGDFFWFGLPLYDYRHPKIEQYAARDIGKDDASKKFIFSVASKELYEGTMHDYNWITIDKDIFPLIKKAFSVAQKRGYMQGTDLNELGITSMNIGWEVPGTFDCGIIFECPQLIKY